MSATAVPWHEARRRAHEASSRLTAETVPLEDAVGRVLADDLIALTPVPHYASSAMDGWAVAGDGPWRILLAGADRGGDPEWDDGDDGAGAASVVLRPGEAVPIVTGGVIPPGTRGVLRREHGAVGAELAGDDDRLGTGSPLHPLRRGGVAVASGGDGHDTVVPLLSVRADIDPGEPRDGLHIRPGGTEAAAGETVFRAGDLLTPAHVAVAAGCGYDEITVVRRPRVRLVLTGGEVVERGIPGPGSVRDSFGPTLPAFLSALGAEVVARHRVGDEIAAILEVFASDRPVDELPARSPADRPGPPVDLIITTGGTGDSPADHVRPALRAAGAELLVDGVAVRPGAPGLLARLPDGRLVIGLPGNPLAAMLAVLTLAHPLVSAMQGRGMPGLGRVRVATALPAGKPGTTLRPYRLVAGEAHPTAWHGAGMLRGLAEAAGVLVVPQDGAAAGSELDALPLPW